MTVWSEDELEVEEELETVVRKLPALIDRAELLSTRDSRIFLALIF